MVWVGTAKRANITVTDIPLYSGLFSKLSGFMQVVAAFRSVTVLRWEAMAYDADRGITTGYWDSRPPLDRDTEMMRLHRLGWTNTRIAKRLGNITRQGVGAAIRRCKAGRMGQARDARDC